MVSCKHCSTPNSLDSTFCKRCGTALPAEDVQAAQEKLTALIAEGNAAFNEGKTDEAMAVAESACLSNPSSIPALSLKALCHERRGELAEALECADTIVDLNPDSELDKIKRNQLRTKLSVSVQLATQPPDRRTALIGAVATVVLVLCIGIGLAKVVNRPDATKNTGPVALRDNSAATAPQQSGPANGNYPQQGNAPTTEAQPRTDDTTQARNPLTRPRATDEEQPVVNPFDPPILVPNGTIPASTKTGGTAVETVKTPTSPTQPDKPSTGDDPPPAPDDRRGVSAQDNNPGTVDIQISGATKRSFGGGTDNGIGAGGATALKDIGIQRFQLGSYAAAAASFEKALSGGGDQVSLNQWLGRCYGNMGKKSEQIDAYKRCVAACQTAINSGSGNKDRVRGILDTCQQELKVLQGN